MNDTFFEFERPDPDRATAHERGRRLEYLAMMDRIGARWLRVFEGDTVFYSAAYWDLFCGLWRTDRPVRKTDAMRFLTAVRSPRTAAKYIENAIAAGFVRQLDDPQDRRAKLLALSPGMRERLDAFFDEALAEMQRTSAEIEK